VFFVTAIHVWSLARCVWEWRPYTIHHSFNGVGGGGAEDVNHPEKFWWKSGKIPENPGKIHGNLGKISKNLRNICEKMAPNVVWFEKKWHPTFAESHEDLSVKVIPKRLLEKLFAQKVAQTFFRQFWGNPGKNPSHPQQFGCSYTHG